MQHLVEPLVVSWGYESLEARDPALHRSSGVDRHPRPLGLAHRAQGHRVPVQQQLACRARPLPPDDLEVHEQITELTGETPICPASDQWFRQMAALPLPAGTDLNALKIDLYDQFQIEIPILDLNDRCYIRPSAQGYNQPEDYDHLVRGLGKLLGT